jgi:hypothetical protein
LDFILFDLINFFLRSLQGYDYTDTNLTWQNRTSIAKATLLESSPCYNASKDSVATGSACYQTMMRLAYLNQQSDVGSLILRQGKDCLTQDELNQIFNVSFVSATISFIIFCEPIFIALTF